MRFQITDGAKKGLSRLEPEMQQRVLTAIRDDLPGAIASDPEVKLTQGEVVRVHRARDDEPLIFYRAEPGEVTVVALVSRDEFAESKNFFRTHRVVPRLGTRASQFGYQVLSQLEQVDS